MSEPDKVEIKGEQKEEKAQVKEKQILGMYLP